MRVIVQTILYAPAAEPSGLQNSERPWNAVGFILTGFYAGSMPVALMTSCLESARSDFSCVTPKLKGKMHQHRGMAAAIPQTKARV